MTAAVDDEPAAGPITHSDVGAVLAADEYPCLDCPTIISAAGRRRGPRRCPSCRTQAQRLAARARLDAKGPDARWVARIRWQYKMTVADYEQLCASQGGRCAICRTDKPGGTQAADRMVWSIDHDHDTGKVRGLLCSACNRGLGLFGDSAEACRRAADYLERARDSG